MSEYFLTVYEPSGEVLVNERIEAANDEVAKELGQKKITENQHQNHTHRLTRSGKLIMFHV
ncbi:YhzD family protein [Bacillus sp. FJAT-45037]|uniref:YhzD family protein n=1 Tax=Bacillus sp. FJAT-45037 TaxID=2011007 RepID=UPI000C24732B|nr:YhzD family protein [Bacillus sp. FJAT-45037]